MRDYIFFDLDGTLIDNQEGIVKSVYYALDALGVYDGNADTLQRFIGPPLLDSFRRYYDMSETGAARAVEKYRERYRKKGIYECRPYPHVPAMLQALVDAGKTLCIASSKPQVFVEEILSNHNLTHFFSDISAASLDHTVVEKPDILRLLLSRLPADATDRAVMVGDREFDVLGAHECGLPCIGVSYGFAQPGELSRAGADELADSVPALQAILLKL